MDFGTMGAIIGSVWGAAIGGASVLKTLYGKKFCDKHDGLSKDVSDLVRLAEAVEKLELRMANNESDRKDLHTKLTESMNTSTSWFYDIKMVMDVLSESLINDELNKKTIEKILNRKTRGEIK